MVEIETFSDIAEEMADLIGIYGEERSFFTGELADRMRTASKNEKLLYG